MKITIARALNEVKLLGKRIEKAQNQISFLQMSVGENGTLEPQDAKDFSSSYQALNDLILRKAKIKNAITLANAQTTVALNNQTYSIAEAIALKEGIQAQSQMLIRAGKNYQAVKAHVNSKNEDAEDRLSRMLEANFGKDRKASGEDFEAIAGPFRKANLSKVQGEEQFIIDFEKAQLALEDFTSEIDFLLSEVNATTEIEIPE